MFGGICLEGGLTNHRQRPNHLRLSPSGYIGRQMDAMKSSASIQCCVNFQINLDISYKSKFFEFVALSFIHGKESYHPYR